MTSGPLHNIPEDGRPAADSNGMPVEISASGKTAEKRPSSIGFREGSDDTVSEISDGHEWFYETICSKFEDGAVPSTIQEYRSRATDQKRATARRGRNNGTTAAAAPGSGSNSRGPGSRGSASSPSPVSGTAPGGPYARNQAEPANIDDVLAENFQLKEINKSVWRELQALRQRSQKVTDDAERSRRRLRHVSGDIESLQEQLATSLSLVESMEREKEESTSKLEDLQKLVADLTDKLASTTDELKAAKQDNRRKSRQISMLENSVKVSGRDLDRTKRSLKDKIRKTICMELEIESLQEDLQSERESHAGSSRRDADHRPITTYSEETPTALEAKIGSDCRNASTPSSLLEAKLVTVLEEQETLKERHAQEKLDMEERHRAQLEKTQEEADAEKDKLLREMNVLEQMLLDKQAGTASRNNRTTPDPRSTRPTQSSKGLRSHLKQGGSATDRRRRGSGDNPYLAFSKGGSRRGSQVSHEHGSQESHKSKRRDANTSNKSNTSRNPQQDSQSTIDSLREISEMVRKRAIAA